MTRPRGLIRQALGEVFAQRAPLTWRDACEHACVGYTLGRMTVENMARAGELRAVDTTPVAGRAMVRYAPAGAHTRAAAEPQAADGWASFT